MASTKISQAAEEVVCNDLTWLANFLHTNFNLSFPQIKKLIREKLDASV